MFEQTMLIKDTQNAVGLKRLFLFWFGPVAAIRLSAFRAAMAMAVFFYLLNRWADKEEWLSEAGFHVSAQNLPYHQLSVPLLPTEFLPWFGVILFGSLIAVICGWRLNWTIWVAWGCLFYVTMADQLSSFVINKLSVVALLTVALGSVRGMEGRPRRFDSLCECKTNQRGRPRISQQRLQSAWPVRILQITLIASYFTAGFSKIIGGEWLKDPYVLWSQLQGTYRTDFAAWLLRMLPLGTWPVIQYAALAFEILAPFHFGIKRLRGVGLVWGLGFQLMIAATMHQLIYFSLVMLSFYVLFIDEKALYKAQHFFLKNGFKKNHQPFDSLHSLRVDTECHRSSKG